MEPSGHTLCVIQPNGEKAMSLLVAAGSTEEMLKRFMAKTTPGTSIVKEITSCLEWTAALDREGYPKFWMDGKMIPARKASYILCVGAVPSGEVTTSLCGVRTCVRPGHLVTCTLRLAHALRVRGPASAYLGDLSLIVQTVRNGEASPKQIAESYAFPVEFIDQVCRSDLVAP